METIVNQGGYTTDEVIVQKVVDGETALFELLVRRHNASLYKLARTYGFIHDDAQDLVQETHVAAYRNLHSFRRDAQYKTWLTRIHLNACYRRQQRQQRRAEEALPANASERLVAASETPEAQLQHRELRGALEAGLEQLTEAYRLVFVLRMVEGYSTAETAQLLGLSEVNVKVRLNRARTLLQQQLEKFYSKAELYEFNLVFCDRVVEAVFREISAAQSS